jgi:hypothetical protein
MSRKGMELAMKREENLKTGGRASSRFGLWHIIGGAVVALFAYGVITSLPDIKRYWRIRHM